MTATGTIVDWAWVKGHYHEALANNLRIGPTKATYKCNVMFKVKRGKYFFNILLLLFYIKIIEKEKKIEVKRK